MPCRGTQIEFVRSDLSGNDVFPQIAVNAGSNSCGEAFHTLWFVPCPESVSSEQ